MSGSCLLVVGAAHAAVLAALQGRCFPDEPWGMESMAVLLAGPETFGLLAMADAGQAPVGFALWRVTAGEAEILSLGVLPEARRCGFGRALVEAGAAEAAARGGVEAFLEVAEDNRAARRLYGRSGFVEAGRRPGYYRRPNGQVVAALVLRRSLP